ncbi:uncharacterized protein N7518_008645 [Penicillium psychrosexuale]|uniref:uncharacterized protein n=1 Tax=Penicillium psychrosexuale TaxID=1002107 RepID=UPI0025453EB5|nr:uncharacterized protein N7518_008645 [Penicillium psychrosexuale]KAJ5791634.1 hypothetical protein N7518_008645 [Penicillium psychrosexuale]
MQSVMPSTRLCANTWLSNPEKAIPGQLIIICTWLGASPKHVGKYTDLYRSIAPHARILLIESDVSILVSSYARQRRRIRPVVDIVLETLAETETSSVDNAPRILLHTFSNGGTNTATQLLITLREVASKPLPLIGLVLDSTPAKGTYWKSYNAMVLLPSSRVSLRGLNGSPLSLGTTVHLDSMWKRKPSESDASYPPGQSVVPYHTSQ